MSHDRHELPTAEPPTLDALVGVVRAARRDALADVLAALESLAKDHEEHGERHLDPKASAMAHRRGERLLAKAKGVREAMDVVRGMMEGG